MTQQGRSYDLRQAQKYRQGAAELRERARAAEQNGHPNVARYLRGFAVHCDRGAATLERAAGVVSTQAGARVRMAELQAQQRRDDAVRVSRMRAAGKGEQQIQAWQRVTQLRRELVRDQAGKR